MKRTLAEATKEILRLKKLLSSHELKQLELAKVLKNAVDLIRSEPFIIYKSSAELLIEVEKLLRAK